MWLIIIVYQQSWGIPVFLPPHSTDCCLSVPTGYGCGADDDKMQLWKPDGTVASWLASQLATGAGTGAGDSAGGLFSCCTSCSLSLFWKRKLIYQIFAFVKLMPQGSVCWVIKGEIKEIANERSEKNDGNSCGKKRESHTEVQKMYSFGEGKPMEELFAEQ